MNSDHIKGKAKEIAGNIQKNVGHAVGSTKTEVKGKVHETEGQLQQNVGDVKDRMNQANRSLSDDDH